jgi:hypothetical protein
MKSAYPNCIALAGIKKKSKFIVNKSSNQIASQAKTFSTITILFFEDAKNLQSTVEMFANKVIKLVFLFEFWR